jgi:cyclopropane fatty-acyl-phospholipid synthase-like methyltransferase
MSDDVSTAEYWNALYVKGDTGWDKGRCSPPIARMLREGIAPKAARLAVIGAGRGHEAVEAARLGYRVSSIDFAEEAARGVAAAALEAGVEVEVLQEDLFHLPKRRPGHYDAVVEQTCFCAIAIERRPEYVEAVHALLKKGGVLFGLFYAHGKPGGPPFDTSEEELRRLFSARFELSRLMRAADSYDHRAGKELEAVFTAR